jgi:hypothetical protein
MKVSTHIISCRIHSAMKYVKNYGNIHISKISYGKTKTENQRKFYMECRKRLQLGFDINVQEKAHEPQQFEASFIYLFLVYLTMLSVPRIT